MLKEYFDDLFKRLTNDDPESVGRAMDEISKMRSDSIDLVLAAWQRSSHRYLIAERLPIFGSDIVPRLRDIVDNSKIEEIKILAALVLAQLNSLDDYALLENEIEKNGQYACIALHKIALNDLDKSIFLTLKRLSMFDAEKLDKSEQQLVACYLSFLASAGVNIPESIQFKYQSDAMPMSIRLLVK